MTPPAQPARPDWLANPALPCRRMDPELFFPLDIRQPDPAVLAACGACPARDACLGRALQAGEIEPESGIWGGTTPAERRIMLRLDGAA